MEMTAKDVLEILEKAKDLGIVHLKMNGIEADYAPRVSPKHGSETVPEVKFEEIVAPASPFDNLSEQEILYYAVPYGLELEAERLAQIERAKEGPHGND